MIKLRKQLAKAFLVASLMLPWATAEALKKFEEIGGISKIGYSTFVVDGREYRLAPGAKLKSSSSKRKKFSDFKKGDEIYFKGTILNGLYYVDIIVYETPEPS